MQLDLDVTNPIDIEGSVFQLAAVAVAILHRLEVITALEAGQAAQSSRCSLHVTVRTYWVVTNTDPVRFTTQYVRDWAVLGELGRDERL